MNDARALAGLRVKPLEWVKHPERDAWRVDTMLGTYKVFAITSPVSWTFDGGFAAVGGKIDLFAASPEAAKAAAQADYEARILSAIDRLAAPEGVGLTRYTMSADTLIFTASPAGEWVRHEDAAAALAAERKHRERAEKRCANLDEALDDAAGSVADESRRVREYWQRKLTTAEAERDALKAALAPVLASLVAAISVLERSAEEGAPANLVVASDKMFRQMIDDYHRAVQTGRDAALSKTQGGG